MGRTTITLSDSLRNRLKVLAAERGVSFAELVREALEKEAADSRPKPQFGIGASGYTDTAETIATEPVPPVSWR